MVYKNADIQKLEILKDNKNKSGIYGWINSSNGNSYVGSSTNLSRRLLQYFNTKYLLKYPNFIICKALIKQGYSNFSLEIIEYCDSDKCLEREQYYLDLLNPKYNILKIAGSTLGFKYS